MTGDAIVNDPITSVVNCGYEVFNGSWFDYAVAWSRGGIGALANFGTVYRYDQLSNPLSMIQANPDVSASSKVTRRDGEQSGPDFFCVGAQKGGTRWLYDQVQLHPDFWMPPIKELHYFDRKQPSNRAVTLMKRASADLGELNRKRRRRQFRAFDESDIDFLKAYIKLPWPKVDLEAYARLFSVKGGKISGDITPDYSVLQKAEIRRIIRRFPKARVVFIARDPVERVWSHLTMHMRKGDIDRTASASELMRVAKKRFILRRTFQSEIVARWREETANGQFGLFLFDDLVADAEGFRERILSFLGADPHKASGTAPAGYNRKQDPNKVRLSPQLGRELGRYLAKELEMSAREFGGAAERWPAKYGL